MARIAYKSYDLPDGNAVPDVPADLATLVDGIVSPSNKHLRPTIITYSGSVSVTGIQTIGTNDAVGTPTYNYTQIVMLSGQWRHSVANGEVTVRISDQTNTSLIQWAQMTASPGAASTLTSHSFLFTRNMNAGQLTGIRIGAAVVTAGTTDITGTALVWLVPR